jgi:hypothetical protein
VEVEVREEEEWTEEGKMKKGGVASHQPISGGPVT